MDGAIRPGQEVLVRSAFDELLERRAVTGIEKGVDFPVVWVATETEWEAATSSGGAPDGEPWPAEHVHAADRTTA